MLTILLEKKNYLNREQKILMLNLMKKLSKQLFMIYKTL